MIRMWKYAVILVGLLVSCGSEDEKTPAPVEVEPAKPSVLTYGDVIYLIFDERAEDNYFRIGEKLNIAVSDVSGLEAVDGFFDVGASMEVYTESGELVNESGDLFEIQPLRIPSTEKVNLPLFVDILPPFKAMTTYNMRIKVWDKHSDRKMEIEKTFNVEGHLANGFLDYREETAGLEHLIVFRDQKPYSGNTFGVGERVRMNILLADAFLENTPTVKLELDVLDAQGNSVFNRKESATLEPSMGPFDNHVVFNKDNYQDGTYEIHFKLNEIGGEEAALHIVYPVELLPEADQ